MGLDNSLLWRAVPCITVGCLAAYLPSICWMPGAISPVVTTKITTTHLPDVPWERSKVAPGCKLIRKKAWYLWGARRDLLRKKIVWLACIFGRGEIYSECLKEVVALRLKELNTLQELIIQVSIWNWQHFIVSQVKKVLTFFSPKKEVFSIFWLYIDNVM